MLPACVRRQRRDKARQWRRLRAELGDPAVVDRSTDTQATTDFLALESSGWKGKAKTSVASRAEHAEFYHEVTSRFRASGKLRLYSLEVPAKTLAMSTNFCAGPGLFGWKSAYDERFARYAPGAQLELRLRDVAGEDGLRWFDTCAEVTDHHQLRLTPHRRRIATLVIGRGRWIEASMATFAASVVKVSRKRRELSRQTLLHKLIRSSRLIAKRFQDFGA